MADPAPEPPYLRIVADIRRRIASGELRPGQRVPSTRQIVGDWGVAMATATKALATLRQEGVVRAVSGSGTIVNDPGVDEPGTNEAASPRQRPRRTGTSASPGDGGEPSLSRERIVRAAIGIADAHGRAALSMRRVAAELDVGTMSLYRYVPDKDELMRLMADAAFAEVALPEPGPDGWRAKLEHSARSQWRVYRRHPWLAPILLSSLTDPPVVPSGLILIDWELRALDGLGMDRTSMLHAVVTLNSYIGGLALTRALESEDERATGISSAQRQLAERPLLTELLESGRFPMLLRMSEAGEDIDLDSLFEFGLQRQLDGIAAYLASPS